MLSDFEIELRCLEEHNALIKPFITKLIKEANGQKVISYGLSSYGYDIRLGNKFFLHSPVNQYGSGKFIADPKASDDIHYVELYPDEQGRIIIPPHGFVLCHSVEMLNVHRDLLAICIGKSTYARLGLVVNVTPLEPEWSGQITIEISNTTPTPVAVYPGEGIAQLVFLKASDSHCLVSYKDRSGKYQDQTGVTFARV